MKGLCAATLALVSLLFVASWAASGGDPVLGTWEGESKCTVPDSPCRDEHVIYEIAADEKAAGRLKIDAYKVVKGEKEFMGTVGCTWQAPRLSCTFAGPRENHWEFTVSGAEMTGTLTVGKEKTLYRRVAVKRKP